MTPQELNNKACYKNVVSLQNAIKLQQAGYKMPGFRANTYTKYLLTDKSEQWQLNSVPTAGFEKILQEVHAPSEKELLQVFRGIGKLFGEYELVVRPTRNYVCMQNPVGTHVSNTMFTCSKETPFYYAEPLALLWLHLKAEKFI